MKVFILLLLVSALLQGVVCDVDIDIEYESAELSGGILDENISTTASTGASEQDPFDARQTSSEFLFRCNDESLEPSLLDVLQALIPDSLPEMPTVVKEIYTTATDAVAGLEIPAVLSDVYAKTASTLSRSTQAQHNKKKDSSFSELPEHMLEAASNWTEASLSALVSTRMPFNLLIKDGIFVIERGDTSLSLSTPEIHIVQQSHLSLGYLCRLAFEYNIPLTNHLCSCRSSAPSGSSSFNPNSMWCRRDFVCPADSASKICQVRVDPFRQSCIAYRGNGAVKSIKYETSMPLVKDSMLWRGLCDTWESVSAFLGAKKVISDVAKRYPTPFAFVTRSVEIVSRYTPAYVANGFLGIVLIASADVLTESVVFQYSLAALGGLALAVLWVMYLICTTTSSLLTRTLPGYQNVAPLANILFGHTTALYFFFSSQWLLRAILDGVQQFWHEGVFGVQWAGKAFFISSMLISMGTTYFLGLFRPKSLSAWLLLASMKLLGAVLLFNGTSNGEMSCAFVVLGIFQDQLIYYQYRLQIEIIARSSNTNYVRKVSNKEFEDTKRSTTERELKKLQAFLNKNQDRTDRYYDTLFVGGRRDAAKNLYRFSQGDMSVATGGRPSWGGGASPSRGSFGGAGGGWFRSSSGGDDDYDSEGDDENAEEEFDDDVVEVSGPEGYDDGKATPTRIRESLTRKSPASQRRALKQKTSLIFRLIFPVFFVLLLTAGVALVLLRFQSHAQMKHWANILMQRPLL